MPRLGLSLLASCIIECLQESPRLCGSLVSATLPCSHFLFLPLSWRPIFRLLLPFLDTLLNMSIVRSSCSLQSHVLWEVLLGLAIFSHPYELRLASPISFWKAHLKHSSWVLLPEGASFHLGVHNGVMALATLFSGHSENYRRLASSPRNLFQAHTPTGQQILPWYTTELYLVTVSSTRLYCFWYQGQGAVITAICTVVYWSLTGVSSIVFDECISPAVLLHLCFLTTLAFV